MRTAPNRPAAPAAPTMRQGQASSIRAKGHALQARSALRFSLAAFASSSLPNQGPAMNKLSFRRRVRSAALAVVLCSAALAQAATGFVVNAAQQASIKVGMSRTEVRALLGRPAHNVKYRAEPGRTWTYGVLGLGSGMERTVFDVDFSAGGQVLSTSQREEAMD